jgi:hypothetical protein
MLGGSEPNSGDTTPRQHAVKVNALMSRFGVHMESLRGGTNLLKFPIVADPPSCLPSIMKMKWHSDQP